MEYFDYFPSRVYRDERPDLVQQVLPICEHYLKEFENSEFLVCGTDHLGREPSLRHLSDYLLLSAGNILRGQGYMVEKYDLYISALGAHEIRKNGQSLHRISKNSQISGWFFIDVPESAASVIYHDPRPAKNMIGLDYEEQDDVLLANASVYFERLKMGTVLFNNSWMSHSLIGGNSEQPTKGIYFTISHRDIICNMY